MYLYPIHCSNVTFKQSAPHDFQGGNVRTIDTELTQARRSLDRMIAVAQRNRLATLPGLKLVEGCWLMVSVVMCTWWGQTHIAQKLPTILVNDEQMRKWLTVLSTG